MKKENKSQESIYNNKGDSTLLRMLRSILPYCIYTKKLPLSLKKDSTRPKTKTSWWTKLTEKIFKKREPINYNFNMDDFYNLKGKIQENRQRMRELFEMYKKIETFYPLFFGYVALIGVYTFPAIGYFLKLESPHVVFLVGVLLLVHIILFILNFFFFFKLIYLKPFENDSLPKDIYSNVYGQIVSSNPRTEETNSKLSDQEYENKIQNETNTEYLKHLESCLDKNWVTYEKKKKTLSRLIKTISISVIVYVILTTTYKLSDMTNKINEKPKTEKSSETKEVKTVVKIPSRTTVESTTSTKKSLNG